MKIDLNADLGEGSTSDRQLLQWVTSANIACGFHAGDAQTMLQSIRWAKEFGVAIGAHPSFPDRENFGRTAMRLPAETVFAQVVYQVGALKALAATEGCRLAHVKPHGMLYNQAAREPLLADVIARAIKAVDPALILLGLAGSELIRAGHYHGLSTRQEAFADRGYQNDGSLVPRDRPGALIENETMAIEQTLSMVQQGKVRSVQGEWITLHAESICLHGDGAHALIFAQHLRNAFDKNGITVTDQ
ncbi:LamB/YcsF family protein [[Pantoea] beijingensis]|uniref:5-oxoprolinase subunit A n=1 Tax=[Pantoea] beijingensis TaxID=1324864 RepID=A0A443IAG8_9GAMM|nr:5-oxoprolinase subunit PxpA [[Pantoea] beijingensis]RWR01132.1 LamB/YcsF family protein [[Pantoea] beijingensis]